MRPLIDRMQAYYARSTIFRVGIGTLCRRASTAMIHEVVRAVCRELPGIPLHLWGVKLGALQSRRGLPAAVVSVPDLITVLDTETGEPITVASTMTAAIACRLSAGAAPVGIGDVKAR
jgi:hypothetical protein